MWSVYIRDRGCQQTLLKQIGHIVSKALLNFDKQVPPWSLYVGSGADRVLRVMWTRWGVNEGRGPITA